MYNVGIIYINFIYSAFNEIYFGIYFPTLQYIPRNKYFGPKIKCANGIRTR